MEVNFENLILETVGEKRAGLGLPWRTGLWGGVWGEEWGDIERETRSPPMLVPLGGRDVCAESDVGHTWYSFPGRLSLGGHILPPPCPHPLTVISSQLRSVILAARQGNSFSVENYERNFEAVRVQSAMEDVGLGRELAFLSQLSRPPSVAAHRPGLHSCRIVLLRNLSRAQPSQGPRLSPPSGVSFLTGPPRRCGPTGAAMPGSLPCCLCACMGVHG